MDNIVEFSISQTKEIKLLFDKIGKITENVELSIVRKNNDDSDFKELFENNLSKVNNPGKHFGEIRIGSSSHETNIFHILISSNHLDTFVCNKSVRKMLNIRSISIKMADIDDNMPIMFSIKDDNLRVRNVGSYFVIDNLLSEPKNTNFYCHDNKMYDYAVSMPKQTLRYMCEYFANAYDVEIGFENGNFYMTSRKKYFDIVIESSYKTAATRLPINGGSINEICDSKDFTFFNQDDDLSKNVTICMNDCSSCIALKSSVYNFGKLYIIISPTPF